MAQLSSLAGASFNESQHPRDDKGRWGSGSGAADTAVVNIPLAKRGNIDNQIDKYKAEQKQLSDFVRKTDAGERKTDKAHAKELYAEHGAALIAKHGAKYGKNEFKSMLDSMVKWEPKKFISVATKFHAENTAAKQ